jgi:long-chain acyl-CoA synthetase
MAVATDKLLLDAAYERERNDPDRVYMTQPLGDGKTIDYTWAETMNQARRMAAYLARWTSRPTATSH